MYFCVSLFHSIWHLSMLWQAAVFFIAILVFHYFIMPQFSHSTVEGHLGGFSCGLLRIVLLWTIYTILIVLYYLNYIAVE